MIATNEERQAARIMVSAAGAMFWGALCHLVRVYFVHLAGLAPRLARRIIARMPHRQQVLGGHSVAAWAFAFGFGVLGGMNICAAAIYVVHTAVGVG